MGLGGPLLSTARRKPSAHLPRSCSTFRPLHSAFRIHRSAFSCEPLAVSRKPLANPNGQVYEQFLGKVIRLTAGHQAKVEDRAKDSPVARAFDEPSVQRTLAAVLSEPNPTLTDA